MASIWTRVGAIGMGLVLIVSIGIDARHRATAGAPTPPYPVYGVRTPITWTTPESPVTIPALPEATATPSTAAAPPATPPPPAPARPIRPRATRSADSYDPYAIGAAALELLSYDWRRLNVSIHFDGARSGYRAVSEVSGRHATIIAYVRASDSPATVAYNVAHELAHVIDVTYMTNADRAAWLSERGRPDLAWYTCETCTDFGVGVGDFAEVFAVSQIGPIDFRSLVAPLPTPAEMDRLVRYFRG